MNKYALLTQKMVYISGMAYGIPFVIRHWCAV